MKSTKNWHEKIYRKALVTQKIRDKINYDINLLKSVGASEKLIMEFIENPNEDRSGITIEQMKEEIIRQREERSKQESRETPGKESRENSGKESRENSGKESEEISSKKSEEEILDVFECGIKASSVKSATLKIDQEINQEKAENQPFKETERD